MKLRFEAALGGKNFSDIAPEVLLRDIVEIPAEMDVQKSRRATRPGQIITGKTRTALAVRLVYNIRAYDVARRAQVRDLVAEWACGGGWLTVNTRPGKRLYVVCETPPNVESSLKWAQDLSMTLYAYAQPYWEKEDEVTVSIPAEWSNTHGMYYGAHVINPEGNVTEVPVSFIAWNTSDDKALTHLKVMVWNTFFDLRDIAVEPGGMLYGLVQARYDENDILSIRDEMTGVSLMANRTAESSDDLLARCGKDNQIHVYADAPCRVQLEARGRYL